MRVKGENYDFNLPDSALADMKRFFQDSLDLIPSSISKMLVSVFAETRIMPPGTPRPGPWRNDFTPYLVEPMDSMSPYSPVQRDINLKAAQLGLTAAAENIICYFIKICPSDILFMSAGDKLLERWAVRRLEPAIDSFGIRHLLKVSYDNNSKSKMSGDKAFAKDFFGGRLDMASARSASLSRATDKRVLVRDELDGVPSQLSTGEGYWLDVSMARTNFWEDRKKIFDLGTPTTYEDSEIYKAYLLGDQRFFLVPCPLCGKFQKMEFGRENTQYGIKPITVAGELVDAVYMCDYCHDAIKVSQRGDMLKQGYWEPTVKPSHPYWRSRHINSCYSPVMRWSTIYREYLSAKEKPDGMRSFTNLYEGLPYKDTGTRLSPTRIISLRSDYPRGTVPKGPLFTTVGVDVQRGKDIDDRYPARLELEVCAHGRDFKTWSVEYTTIVGGVDNPFSGAWQELYDKIMNSELSYRGYKGYVFDPRRIFIDSGYNTPVVYAFVQRLRNVFAVQGQGREFVPEAKDQIDKRRKGKSKYKISTEVDGHRMFLISTTDYKRILRSALMVQRDYGSRELQPMLCQFPLDYDQEYFTQLNAFEMLSDGSFRKVGPRDEALDCRIYNMCAGESYLNDSVRSARDAMALKGYSKQACYAINWNTIFDRLEKEVYGVS